MSYDAGRNAALATVKLASPALRSSIDSRRQAIRHLTDLHATHGTLPEPQMQQLHRLVHGVDADIQRLYQSDSARYYAPYLSEGKAGPGFFRRKIDTWTGKNPRPHAVGAWEGEKGLVPGLDHSSLPSAPKPVLGTGARLALGAGALGLGAYGLHKFLEKRDEGKQDEELQRHILPAY